MKNNRKRLILVLGFIFLLVVFFFYFRNNFGKAFYSKSTAINTKENLENKNDKDFELNLLFVGDIMLDRKIRKIINQNNTPDLFVKNYLTNLSEENKKYDYVIANLEGPITENKTKTYDVNGVYTNLLTFTFPTSTIQILNLLNIKVVSLANNHINNFGDAGLQDTKRFLEAGGIKYFGNPYNDNLKESLSNTICEKDICIAYVGYHQFTKDSASKIIEDKILKLKLDKNVDFIVVMPHWGEEYRKTSNSTQKIYAKNWIDAGADLVIGAHPHVTEESEIYKDKYIYYSLGNYIFDQWFQEDVKNGLVLNFKFKKEILTTGEIKKEINLIKEIKVRSEKTGIEYVFE